MIQVNRKTQHITEYTPYYTLLYYIRTREKNKKNKKTKITINAR